MSVKAMAYVWETSYKGPKKLMLLAIADRCDDEGTCYPGVTKLAEKCSVKVRAAQALITDLEKSGEIIVQIGTGVETGHGKTNRYYMKQYRASIGLKTPALGSRIQQITPLDQGMSNPAPLNDGMQNSAPQGMSNPAPQGMQNSAFNTSGDSSVDSSVKEKLLSDASAPDAISDSQQNADTPVSVDNLPSEQNPAQAGNLFPSRETSQSAAQDATATTPYPPTPLPTAMEADAPSDVPVGDATMPKGKQARSEKQTANDEAKRIAMNALAAAMGVTLVKPDEKRWSQIAQTLVAGTIPYSEFETYVKRLKGKAEKEGNWTVTVESLIKGGRISEYVTARDKYRQNQATKGTGVPWGVAQVSTTPRGSKNGYSRHSDPAYASVYETPSERKQAK